MEDNAIGFHCHHCSSNRHNVSACERGADARIHKKRFSGARTAKWRFFVYYNRRCGSHTGGIDLQGDHPQWFIKKVFAHKIDYHFQHPVWRGSFESMAVYRRFLPGIILRLGLL
jgi:hypothetical protein